LDIVGAVDWFEEPNVFVGWAESRGSERAIAPHIEAVRNGTIVGVCVADLPRAGAPDRHIAFRIAIKGTFEPLELLTGELLIRARGKSGEFPALTIYRPLAHRLIALAIPALLVSFGDRKLLDVLTMVANETVTGPRKRLVECLQYLKSNEEQRTIPGGTESHLSSFDIPVGLFSPSQVVTVGRNGYLFVSGGTNRLTEQYALNSSSPDVVASASEWIRLLTKRADRFADLGIVYRQMMIPEKASLIPEYFPVAISPPTPLMRAVETGISAHPTLAGRYVNARHAMASNPARLQLLRKLDSHLSPAGAAFLCSLVLKSMDLPDLPGISFSERRIGGGDLAAHFVDFRAREAVHFPAPDQFSVPGTTLQKAEEHLISSGRHIGARTVWQNSRAQVQGKLLVFGNSFFEHGDYANMLSWWFARCFSEYHFVWSPTVDFAYVNSVRPDYVICQTIERYLQSVPAS